MDTLSKFGDGRESQTGDNLVYKVLGHSFYLLSVNKNLKYSAKTHLQRTAGFFYFHLPFKLLLPLFLLSSSFSIHSLLPVLSLSYFFVIKFQLCYLLLNICLTSSKMCQKPLFSHNSYKFSIHIDSLFLSSDDGSLDGGRSAKLAVRMMS